MDLIDSLALLGRRFTPRRAVRSGSERFSLMDVMETFNGYAILELSQIVAGKPVRTLRPDAERKLKVSLLDDGMADIHTGSEGWYRVAQTAPSADLSKVRIEACAADGSLRGEIRFLIGRRTYEHYFREDPILASIAAQGQ